MEIYEYIKPKLGESKNEYIDRVVSITTCIDWMKHCLGDMMYDADFTYFEELKETLNCQFAGKEGEPNIVIENCRFWDLGYLVANVLVKERGFTHAGEGQDEEGTRLYWLVEKGENRYEVCFRATFGKTYIKQLKGNEDDFWDDFNHTIDYINEEILDLLYKAYRLREVEITKEPKENWMEKEVNEAIKIYNKAMKKKEADRFQNAFKDTIKF